MIISLPLHITHPLSNQANKGKVWHVCLNRGVCVDGCCFGGSGSRCLLLACSSRSSDS
ncbi:hypothetical protein ACHAWT_007239 [Skeletonema menzelii]